jgi:hypothetical protein
LLRSVVTRAMPRFLGLILLFAAAIPAACGRREAATGHWQVGRPDAAIDNQGQAGSAGGGETKDPGAPTVQAPDAAAPAVGPAGNDAAPGAPFGPPGDNAIRDAASDGDARGCFDADHCD